MRTVLATMTAPLMLVLAQMCASTVTAQLAPSPPAAQVHEVTVKNQRIRATRDPGTGTLVIQHNGNPITEVADVGDVLQPYVLSGANLSLVMIPSKRASTGCASYVLVAVPEPDRRALAAKAGPAETRPVETRSGVGDCSTTVRTIRLKHGSWELWAVLAISPTKVQVAVDRDGRLDVSDHAIKPCLIASGGQEYTQCNEDYIAMALGAVERGIPVGDQRVSTHRLQIFLNRRTKIGTIEIDGTPLTTVASISDIRLEPASDAEGTAIFSVWLQPAPSGCGYRMMLQVPADARDLQRLNDVGQCRGKNLTQVKWSADKRMTSWMKVMWRDRDNEVDLVSLIDGRLVETTVQAAGCFAGPGANATSGAPDVPCLEQLVAAQAAESDGLIGNPRRDDDWRERRGRRHHRRPLDPN
jgi:hypothetical protein